MAGQRHIYIFHLFFFWLEFLQHHTHTSISTSLRSFLYL